MISTTRFLIGALLLAAPADAGAGGPADLVRLLEDAASSETAVYRLKDDAGRKMDCLKVFQPDGDEFAGIYYGVYHCRENGVFVSHLARSTDLRRWTQVVALDERASQPTVAPYDGGSWLLACEKDQPGACWIRLRYYRSLNDLLHGAYQREVDLPRTLAPTAEGTPSVESVTLGEDGLDGSEIKLRFHYYKNRDVDQLARGTLANFATWTTTPSAGLNAELRDGGWRGNLGDRDRFAWRGETYYLQEVQRKKHDWSSWRICLCDGDGMPLRTLSVRTPHQSTAFANPNATPVVDAEGRRRLVVTLFLPSEGNAPSEVGTLLYSFAPPAAGGGPAT
ncbi:hypothetical protein [Alienimonas chondri]|uniref:Uncharacterized protein n=1 Tax=Alienimonas chondri TaxID=2681879 RepID=A0ABX1VF80_9PLAN|nr:hypothetical protein [Alienimonas chondri]NNJ26076.1 hypothetical protein [Alienimonas chondri]